MVLPIAVNGFGVKTFTKDSALVKSLIKTNALDTDKILVIIYLNGGNDGLNTVIPLDNYPAYRSLRSSIAIPENKVLSLAGNPKTGLHPSMTGMQNLYNEGKLAIIHSVSYPNPNQSHVRSSDIWMTAVNSNQYTDTGWAGRYLKSRYPNYPADYPNGEMEDPLAVQIGNMNSPALSGGPLGMGVTFENPSTFYQVLGSNSYVSSNQLPCCDAGELINYCRQQQVLNSSFALEVKRAASAGVNKATYPTPVGITDLSEQLKIVARMIHGGLKTKIYFVEMSGFDTHANQVSSTNPAEGLHATLLKRLSDSIAAFQNDLKLQGTEDKVIGMTFSDFGRRASSNGSFGTDHGIAAPMFVFGSGIKRQSVGTNPDLANDLEPPTINSTPPPNQDIKMQIDFRRIYSDILKDWFGTDATTTNSLLFNNFKSTSLFSNVIETVSSGAWPDRNIWSAGCMPGPKDYVKINTGHTVQVGQNITVRNIQVEGGAELSFLGNYRIETTG
ncbi:DUF1501 domain-containing protein [Dyadobacter sp. NIV53]|uniref:DUF1501 domain-containing protein n=1 Tax=Dyadobacter sp. NIV53 TaxID=2861765 RepID=UPI001E4AB9CA|nr:DUF1501 domain-containing protein [Dyadobacter sp. NIV53]